MVDSAAQQPRRDPTASRVVFVMHKIAEDSITILQVHGLVLVKFPGVQAV